MVMSTLDRQLIEAQRTRTQAMAVLAELLKAKTECEATLADEKRSDMFKAVTGQSSLETAIAETRRVLNTLDRQIETALKNLDEDDRDVLGADGLEAMVTAGRLAIVGRLIKTRAG